jgi:pimeloyl-ACP methyl ester carboxylesterase
MPTLEAGGRRLGYEEYGAGQPLILIHGSPGNGKAWARVGERLAGRFRVIAPDLPGYGATTPQVPGEAPAVAYACELIEALIDRVGAPAAIAAHSYGGVVALAVALRARAPTGPLVLFEPVALNILDMTGQAEAYLAAKAMFDDYITTFEQGDGVAVRKMIDFWFGNGAYSALPEQVAAYLRKETAANIRDVRATFGETYAPGQFAKVQVPVQVVVGGRSPQVTHLIASTLAGQLAMGSVSVLPKGTHAMTSTHAGAVADLIEAAAGR